MSEEKSIHIKIFELLIHASYQIRKSLKIDDTSYTVQVSNATDPRQYFLQNVLNEIDKASFSINLATDLLSDKTTVPDHDKALNSKILQSKIDELSVPRRKLVEILIDLIGFRGANKQNFYKHYNYLHEIAKKQKEYKDLETFWECKKKKLEVEIQELEKDAENLALNLDTSKCWYAKKTKHKAIQSKLNDEKSAFKEILNKSKPHQKLVLISYYNSFGKPSELLHPQRIFDNKIVMFKDLEHAISGIATLSMHVISAIKDLIHMHNVTGSLKQISNVIKKNDFPLDLVRRLTKSDVVKGDFVFTPDGPAQIIKISKTKYGYQTFHVEFLKPLSNIKIDQYLPYEIKLLASQEKVSTEILQVLHKTNPTLKVTPQKMQKAIKAQALELWELIKNKDCTN